MTTFPYREGTLWAEDRPVAGLAEQFGTPLYLYSRAALESAFRSYTDALADCDHLVCYAVKANSNIAVLDVLARLGAGFDIVSGGELERVVAAGGVPARIVLSGAAKTPAEMDRALELGIACFNLESAQELDVLNEIAGRRNVIAPVSVRVNPDVDARTHPYISTGLRENKFGVTMDEALRVYQRAAGMPNIEVIGLDCHIGSQLTELAPFIAALKRLLVLVDQLQDGGIAVRHLDLGGGLGVRYRDESPPAVADYIAAIRQEVGDRPLKLLFEPGRSICANAGLLVTRVAYLKSTPGHHFALVDAAMNDLLRPALYQAWLDIQPVTPHTRGESAAWDIVGPVCETADFLGKERTMTLAAEDLLAVFGAGAYAFSMSSNYNSRGRAAEVMVDGENAHLVRQREAVEDLLRLESRLPEGGQSARGGRVA